MWSQEIDGMGHIIMRKIAVIMTCFNRKEMTLRCLRQLTNQTTTDELEFYICDDASTDGTYEAISNEYPDVHLIKSKGNLYWSKGMYAAMKMAVDSQHDYYLMVNDDVDFLPDAIVNMVKTYEKSKQPCGVVGMTMSRQTGEITYGGRVIVPFRLGRMEWGILGNKLIIPEDKEKLTECDFTNWNCFMIDAHVIRTVGLIDPIFEHGAGDYDYSLRMRRHGYNIYIAPDVIGYCERNRREGTYFDKNVPRKRRLKQMLSPKGMPLKSQYRQAYRQNGVWGLFIMTWRYLQLFKCILFKKDIGG